ncbi:hypothetical protein TTHERM_00051840 (macronuclear) [Tetrahymena thermophila SB210]|uniref:Uncharacterized protein n=1 Tax=Tetrahymena thermophila (strain SB210) TaxID=312017 RepID=Q23D05_TETTS|nr:hypothetical protein TTHERM_00051840 [Tetrahymena thermophila SB210]EAR94616.2 hypothetical protein TTHERM_00051840 [Tetrahymena thermophila SB210]|eukprot:XP_001014881.2 hypothetical protein TTHERM_00051840 [Tetrahymena thermophila SB210]
MRKNQCKIFFWHFNYLNLFFFMRSSSSFYFQQEISNKLNKFQKKQENTQTKFLIKKKKAQQMSQQKSRGYNKSDQQHNQYNQQNQEPPKQVKPTYYDLELNSKKNANSVFIKAQVVSIEEQESKFPTSNQAKTLIVSLAQILQERNQTQKAQIKVHPPNPIFYKDLEEKQKEKHYNFFLNAKKQLDNNELVLIEILNGKLKREKENKQRDNNETTKKQKIIQLKEWTQVKKCERFFENNDKKMGEINQIKDITANNKYVNILAVVTAIKPLGEIAKGSQLLSPEFKAEKPEDQPLNHHITLRDQTGEIHCILPNIDKFKSFIQLGKYLFFQKAQIQHSKIKEGETNIFLNIYINEKKQKPKGFIWDCSSLPEFETAIPSIKSSTNLINVSNKVWIVKVPQTQTAQ